MQRCAACGELAVDDEARFCIGCGSPLVPYGRFDAAAPPQPQEEAPPAARRHGTPFIDAPGVTEPAPPPEPQALPPTPDLPPLVPMWMVVAGVLGLVALLVILLLSG